MKVLVNCNNPAVDKLQADQNQSENLHLSSFTALTEGTGSWYAFDLVMGQAQATNGARKALPWQQDQIGLLSRGPLRSCPNVKRQHAGINQCVREEGKVRRISFEDKRNESHFCFFLPSQHTYLRISWDPRTQSCTRRQHADISHRRDSDFTAETSECG